MAIGSTMILEVRDENSKPGDAPRETMVRLRAVRSFEIQPYLKSVQVSVPDPHFPLFYDEGDVLELPFSQAVRLIASGAAVIVRDGEER